MDPQKNDLTEQEELKILGEILEAYIDTPIEKDAFLISDLGLDSFLSYTLYRKWMTGSA